MRTALVVLASLVCAGSASAQSTASVSLTNFRYVLADLDPNDGIDPSLTFAPATAVTSTGKSLVQEVFSAYEVVDSAAGSEAFGQLSVAVNTPRGNASAFISGGLDILSMQSASTLSAANGHGNYSETALSTGYRGFTLSPMTSVTFIGDLVLNAAFTPAAADLWTGSSLASAFIYLGSDLNGTPDSFSDGFTLWTGDNGPPSLSTQLTVTLANALGNSTSNELRLDAATQIHAAYYSDVPAPVPEPSQWAMLMAGAAVLGGAAWRRRRTAPAR
jgi:hypothetical protein